VTSLELAGLALLTWAIFRVIAGSATLSTRAFLSIFVLGGLGGTAAALAGERVARIWTTHERISSLYAGPIDEAGKAFPLVAAMFFLATWKRLSISDWVLVGLAASLGFTFVQWDLYALDGSPMFGALSQPTGKLPALVWHRYLFGSRAGPSAWDGHHVFFVGAATTAFVGLAVGVGARIFGHRIAAALLGALALAVVSFDDTLWRHEIGPLSSATGSSASLHGAVAQVYKVLLEGRLELIVLVAGAVAAAAVEGHWIVKLLGGRSDLGAAFTRLRSPRTWPASFLLELAGLLLAAALLGVRQGAWPSSIRTALHSGWLPVALAALAFAVCVLRIGVVASRDPRPGSTRFDPSSILFAAAFLVGGIAIVARAMVDYHLIPDLPSTSFPLEPFELWAQGPGAPFFGGSPATFFGDTALVLALFSVAWLPASIGDAPSRDTSLDVTHEITSFRPEPARAPEPEPATEATLATPATPDPLPSPEPEPPPEAEPTVAPEPAAPPDSSAWPTLAPVQEPAPAPWPEPAELTGAPEPEAEPVPAMEPEHAPAPAPAPVYETHRVLPPVPEPRLNPVRAEVRIKSALSQLDGILDGTLKSPVQPAQAIETLYGRYAIEVAALQAAAERNPGFWDEVPAEVRSYLRLHTDAPLPKERWAVQA
jgi:RsiW-degrading membrane proteinase PrsW (M82 family)